MVEQERLKYVWDNINLIYLKLDRDTYQVNYDNIIIFSSDNYFKCKIETRYDILVFTIEKEYSLVSIPKYYLHTTNFDNIDEIISILKPIFRDFKIDMISK